MQKINTDLSCLNEQEKDVPMNVEFTVYSQEENVVAFIAARANANARLRESLAHNNSTCNNEYLALGAYSLKAANMIYGVLTPQEQNVADFLLTGLEAIGSIAAIINKNETPRDIARRIQRFADKLA